MIKEYIQKMLLENEEDLKKQEKQMNYLLTELEFQQNQLHLLRKENNTDKNIFSPRYYDFENEQKIESVKIKIERIKDEINYVRERIESFLKKKEEYKILIEEFEHNDDLNQIQKIENQDEKIEVNKSKIIESDSVIEIMKELYEKIEMCLAFLNTDKQKCKNELKTMMKRIKDTVSIIEKSNE